MDKSQITLPPGFDFRTLGRHMPRDRHQKGYVRLVGKTVKKWKGFFHVYVVADGQERRKKTAVILGEKAELKKWEAEQKLAAIIAKETGKVARPDTDQNFRWFWETRFLPIQANWSPHHRVTIEGMFAKHVLPRIGSLKLEDLNRFELQMLLNDLAKTKSPSLIHKIFTYIKDAVAEAQDQDFIEHNPVRKLELPSTAKKPCERFLDLDEIATLDKNLKGRDRLIFRLFIVIGFRPSELFALRWDDIQPGEIRVDEAVPRNQLGETKTEGSRGIIPIPRQIEEELSLYRQFCERTGPRDFCFEARYMRRPACPRSYLRRFLKPKAKELGISGLTYQALRRTFATHFQKHGNPKDAQAVMRHADISTTLGIYTKFIPESARQSLALMFQEMFLSKSEEEEKAMAVTN